MRIPNGSGAITARFRLQRLATATLLGAVLSGCASFEQRGLADLQPREAFYPGVKADAAVVARTFGEQTDLWNLGWLKSFVAVLDLPLSAAADTICLPYDFYRFHE